MQGIGRFRNIGSGKLIQENQFRKNRKESVGPAAKIQHRQNPTHALVAPNGGSGAAMVPAGWSRLGGWLVAGFFAYIRAEANGLPCKQQQRTSTISIMQSTQRALGFVLLILLCSAPAALAQKGKSKGKSKQPAIELRLQLKPGKTYRMWMATDQEITQEIAGQKITINQMMGMGYRYQVQIVDDAGTATIIMAYDSIVVRNKTPMGEVNFNSADLSGDATPETAPYRAMVDAKFTLKLTKMGKVESITGMEEMMGKIVSEMGTGDPAQKAAIEQSLKKMIGNEAMAETIERSMNIYPTTPVAVGDSWNHKMEIAMMMPMTVNTTYTLKNVANGVADLDVQSTVANNANAKPMEMMGMAIDYKLTGTQKGTMKVTVEDGWIATSSLKQTLFGTMSISGENIPDMMKNIPVAVQSTITISSR